MADFPRSDRDGVPASPDIVTRLRQWQAEYEGTAIGIYGQAADEIERLRAGNALLALQLLDLHRGIDHDPSTCTLVACKRCDAWQEARRG